jgi:hypothetical protein
MNDEIKSDAIKFLIGALSVIGARYFPADVNAEFAQYIPTIASGIVAVGLFCWGVYMHRGQKLVPSKSTAITLPTGPEPVGKVLDLTPMTGMAKVVGALLIGFFVFQALPASAASAKVVAATSAPITPQSVAALIQKSAVPDLTYAIKLAQAVNTPQSLVRAQCYQAIANTIAPAAVAALGPPPDPDLVTSIEQTAELVDALQPTSAVIVQCAGAAQLVQLSVLQFIQTVVTGATGALLVAPKL